jgi:hypothetical protein
MDFNSPSVLFVGGRFHFARDAAREFQGNGVATPVVVERMRLQLEGRPRELLVYLCTGFYGHPQAKEALQVMHDRQCIVKDCKGKWAP